LFPAGYEFFVAPPEGAFVPLTEGTAVVSQRFFLVAIQSKRSTALRDRDAMSEIAVPKDGK
jgi:hypothetical protein